MNLKEYEAQLALGTVDFRLAANETQSSTVLQDIIGRTDDIAVLCAVATNPKANIYTLTLLATFPNADEGVIVSCAYHPNTTLEVLKRWMKYPTIASIQAVRQRVRALQLALGVPEEDVLIVKLLDPIDPLDMFKGWRKIDDSVVWPYIPNTQREYTKWTTTGNNSTIEMDDKQFKFVSDPDDITVYCYDKVITVPAEWADKNESQ